MKRKELLLILAGWTIGAGLGIVILAVFRNGSSLGKDSSEAAGLSVPHSGYLAPDFELVALSGERIRLSELRGKAVLLDFWATWRGPCRLEMPTIRQRYGKI